MLQHKDMALIAFILPIRVFVRSIVYLEQQLEQAAMLKYAMTLD